MLNTVQSLTAELEMKQRKLDRVTAENDALYAILSLKGQETLKRYLEGRKVKRVAIYGGVHVGKALYHCLSTWLDAIFVIDKMSDTVFYPKGTLYGIDDIQELNVDLVIITLPSFYREIADALAQRKIANYVSIGEIFTEETT